MTHPHFRETLILMPRIILCTIQKDDSSHKTQSQRQGLGGFIAVGFVVGYEGEWGVEWSGNVHEYPVEIERRGEATA